MAVAVKSQLVPADKRYQGAGTNKRNYLTVHQTDNFKRGAGAQAHANLQSGGYKSASWHWQVDDKIAIQSYPESAIAWHAGDGKAGTGNLESIGVEMCVNPDSDYETAFDNTAWLAAQIMKRNSIPMSRLVQHNHWTGKNCPSVVRNKGQWQRFRNLVASYLGEGPASPSAPQAPVEKKGSKVSRAQYKDSRLPITLKPGEHRHLRFQKNSKNTPGTASNVARFGTGAYTLTAHVYASGRAGDQVDVTVRRQKHTVSPKTKSTHWAARFRIGRNAARINTTFQPTLYAGEYFFVRVSAPKNNKGPVRVTELAVDSTRVGAV